MDLTLVQLAADITLLEIRRGKKGDVQRLFLSFAVVAQQGN